MSGDKQSKKKYGISTAGNRIWELRTERGISTDELGSAIGASVGTIKKWESGARNIDGLHLIALVKFFGVSADYLIGFPVPKTPNTKIKDICAYTGLSEDAVNVLHNAMQVIPLEALDKLRVLVENDDYLDVSDHPVQFGEDESLPFRMDAFNKFMVSKGEKFIEILSHIYFDCVAVQHLVDELQTDNQVSPEEFNALEANLKREKSNLEMSLFKFSRLCNVIPDVFDAWNLLEPFERKVTVC